MRRTAQLILPLIVLAIGLTGLARWTFDLPILYRFSPTGPDMLPNSAIALILTSSAVLLLSLGHKDGQQRLWVGAFFSVLTLAFGLLNLAEYVFHVDFGIDRLFFATKTAHEPIPGRSSPEAATQFTLIGLALLLIHEASHSRVRRLRQFSHALAGITFLLGMAETIGYITRSPMLFSLISAEAIGIALPTAFSFVLLSLSLLLQPPPDGVSLFYSRTSGGTLARHLVVLALSAPPVLAITLEAIRRLPQFPDSAIIGLSILTTMAVFIIMILKSAKRLERTEIERESIELQNRMQKNILEQIRQYIPVGIWLTDAQGVIQSGNPAGLRIWGGERKVGVPHYHEYVGWWDETGELIESEDWPLARALRTGKTCINDRVRIRAFDGAFKTLLNSAFPLRDESGKIIAGVAVNIDITEEARLERQQSFLAAAGKELLETFERESLLEKAAALAVEMIADYCFIYLLENGDPVPTLKTARCRPSSACDLTLEYIRQYKPDPRVPGGIIETLRTGKAHVTPEITEALYLGLSQDNQKKLQTLHDEFKSYVSLPLIAHGRVFGVLLLVLGTSGRSYSREDLPYLQEFATRLALSLDNSRLYETSQRAIQLRQDVLSFVSHDLSNPLQSVLSTAEMLQRLPEKDSSVMLAHRLGQLVESSAVTMQRLIQQLRDLAKIEAGRFVIDSRPCDAVPILKQVRDAFQPLARQKRLTLVVEEPRAPVPFHGDPDEVYRVFSNLVGNAIKFTPEGGTITVRSTHPSEETVGFEIQDNGPGIAPDVIPRLFQRYGQARATATRGSGLGLAIAKGIVEAHGGNISVETAQGRGTTFRFTLPIHKPAQKAA